MAAPSITQSQFYSAGSSSMAGGTNWSISLPALTSASDGYILVVASSSGTAINTVVDQSNALYWFDENQINGKNGRFVMDNGVTYGINVYGAPLPALLGAAAQTWGGGTQTISFASAPDSVVACAFGVVGDDTPNWLTWDRGVLDGPVFFDDVNTTTVDTQAWQSNTFDTLNLVATISDNGGLGGSVPSGFTSLGGAHIWITNYIQMTIGQAQTLNKAVPSTNLSWSFSNIPMATRVWSMSNARGLGGAGLLDNIQRINRTAGRNKLISPVMR